MRRLIFALFCWSIGIRVRTNTQHIADLERMLSGLVSARDTLEAEITETTRRLIDAQRVRDAIGKQRSIWMCETAGAQPLPGRNPPPSHAKPPAPPTPPPARDIRGKATPIIPQPAPERRSL